MSFSALGALALTGVPGSFRCMIIVTCPRSSNTEPFVRTSDSRNCEKVGALPDSVTEPPASEMISTSDEDCPWLATPHPDTRTDSEVSNARVIDFMLTVVLLESEDPRRDEDQQLAAVISNRIAPEQPAKQRDAVQAGRAVLLGLLAAHVNAADHCRVAVTDQHLGDRPLRIDRADRDQSRR